MSQAVLGKGAIFKECSRKIFRIKRFVHEHKSLMVLKQHNEITFISSFMMDSAAIICLLVLPAGNLHIWSLKEKVSIPYQGSVQWWQLLIQTRDWRCTCIAWNNTSVRVLLSSCQQAFVNHHCWPEQTANCSAELCAQLYMQMLLLPRY